MNCRVLVTWIALLISTGAYASKVDTVRTQSASMHKDIKAVVITPDSYSKDKQYPVLYLLHGYSGNYADWTRSQAVREAPDNYDLIIVCADGAYGSWYWDSPVDSAFKYETYVSGELVHWVDTHYSTIRGPKGRAITGLSMGGHGGLYLGIKHPDVYGAAGSMSGGVDIRPFPNNWDMSKRLGRYAQYPERWEQNTVVNLLHLIEPNTLKIIIDCGTGDFFYKVNEELHQKLLLRNIPHDYITRPGGHTWSYWENAVKYQLLFMSEFFKTKEKK